MASAGIASMPPGAATIIDGLRALSARDEFGPIGGAGRAEARLRVGQRRRAAGEDVLLISAEPGREAARVAVVGDEGAAHPVCAPVGERAVDHVAAEECHVAGVHNGRCFVFGVLGGDGFQAVALVFVVVPRCRPRSTPPGCPPARGCRSRSRTRAGKSVRPGCRRPFAGSRSPRQRGPAPPTPRRANPGSVGM